MGLESESNALSIEKVKDVYCLIQLVCENLPNYT